MAEKKTILVIDDDPDIIETVHTILSAKGYVIISASSGKQGFELAQQANPDLILCDMMMEAIDSGMQAAEQIKKLNNDIPVFLLSSIADMTAATTQIRDLGFIGIIQKPVEPARLVSIVQSIIG
ncbi:response regulator transcription factor [Desulfococcus sp.]|uniref:response regulator transcription factor n=1 Tax=Desulfococcus sp. TaxID=2025834 RepID=UPI003593EB0C